MRFQASELSNYGAMSNLASAKVADVASTTVRSAGDIILLARRVKAAIQAEKIPSSSTFAPVERSIDDLAASAAGTPASQLAPWFVKLKSSASLMGATETAKAITTAAGWYYRNVENPKALRTRQAAAEVPEEQGGTLPPEVAGTKPGIIGWVKEHPLQVALGAVALVGLGGFSYYMWKQVRIITDSTGA